MHARIAAAAALAAALAVPSAAQAAGSLIGGPIQVRDYEMTVLGSDGAKDSLSVIFSKTKGKSSQQHMYTFDSGVTVTPTSIKGSLGRYGAVDLKLGSASSAKGSVPKGCTGKPGTTKKGTLAGSFKLVADTTYFKTVTARSMTGSSSTGGSIRCDGGASGGGSNPGGRETTLLLTKDTPAGSVTFSATKRQQTAMRMDDAAATAPASVMHFISAEGSGLSVQGLETASAKGIAPFLRGTGSFSGEASGTMASGTLGGSLTAAFDSIGAIELDGDAMLMP
ncbi:MAG TPA: hypothetical protein VIL49_03825 [Capillimicrobium sp.]|jgi:hypothetical protein